MAQLRMHVLDASRDVMLDQCMGERREQMHALDQHARNEARRMD